MRRFCAAFFLLKNVSEGRIPNGLQFVALCLSFPCFKLSDFFFKLTYSLQQRRALILRGKCRAIGIDKLGLEFEELRLEGCTGCGLSVGGSNVGGASLKRIRRRARKLVSRRRLRLDFRNP